MCRDEALSADISFLLIYIGNTIMTINLVKGQPINLAKQDAITKIVAGLQWDARRTDGAKFDADISLMFLGENGNVLDDDSDNVIFYNNLQSKDGSTKHSGDNKDGLGEGYDEVLTVELHKVTERAKRIVFMTSVHNVAPDNLNFGQITNASIDINIEGGEKYTYDLTEDHSSHRAVILLEVYRHQDNWRVKALGEGFEGGFMTALQTYGVK